MGVHATATANRQVLERPLVATDPPDLERWLNALVVPVRVGGVAVVGGPVIPRPGEATRQAAADLF